MSTDLTKHLWPQGRSTSEPDLMPNVLDSDGNTVKYSSSKRKTTEATVVNLGDSPNSNNGDPLRTAFAKINNFIEASYWTNEGINQKFRDIDSELNEGISFYTDSEVRYSISMLGDSKFYFRGTENQIELNVTNKHSPNNPFDWDSEVTLNFQLTETVDISTLNVKERATFDSDIEVKGNAFIRNDLHVDSDVTVLGNVILGTDSDNSVTVRSRISSHLIPYGDEIYSLGDSDNKWRDLYLSGSTIYLGSIQIKNYNNRGIILVDSDGKTLDLAINAGRASTLVVDSDMVVDGLTRLLGDLSVKQNASFDSDVFVTGIAYLNNLKSSNGTSILVNDDVVFFENVFFDSDVRVRGNLTIDQDISTNGSVYVKESLTVDSDVNISGRTTTKDLTVQNYATFEDEVTFQDNVTFDSDISVAGTIYADKFVSTNPGGAVFSDVTTFSKEVTFNDDVVFNDNARFDSDVYIVGSLTVNGTTTYVNTKNLEVTDNLIVINRNQSGPLNNTGIIFQRYDSDLVSLTNNNAIFVWDEANDEFIVGQTSSSGILPNPTITKEYITLGDRVELFDSDGTTRFVWNRAQARLSILNRDGSEAFAFDADSGQMEGNGTIDAGFF